LQTASPILPASDLGLAGTPAPEPLILGQTLTLTNTITVTNFGPAQASGVVVTDVLAPTLSFVSATTTKGTWTRNANTLTFDVGSLPYNTGARLTVLANPTQLGTYTNVATVAGDQLDMNTPNNTARIVSTILSLPTITATRQGNTLVISWPNESGFVLQQTDDLTTQPWADVSGGPVVVGARLQMTMPISAQKKFYRLRSP
jgi:uncharacterized repeat protein (TIGR01451 family)